MRRHRAVPRSARPVSSTASKGGLDGESVLTRSRTASKGRTARSRCCRRRKRNQSCPRPAWASSGGTARKDKVRACAAAEAVADGARLSSQAAAPSLTVCAAARAAIVVGEPGEPSPSCAVHRVARDAGSDSVVEPVSDRAKSAKTEWSKVQVGEWEKSGGADWGRDRPKERPADGCSRAVAKDRQCSAVTRSGAVPSSSPGTLWSSRTVHWVMLSPRSSASHATSSGTSDRQGDSDSATGRSVASPPGARKSRTTCGGVARRVPAALAATACQPVARCRSARAASLALGDRAKGSSACQRCTPHTRWTSDTLRCRADE
mmetsp:Transcript_13233/g.41693  ORF Transcript_13233/g.41693 Transcript_13233/m.41693 type:complete len:319 (-) Transcript_13233:843-1799(-)